MDEFIRDLKRDGILDGTMVLLTSNLGNASSHDNTKSFSSSTGTLL